MRVASTPDMLSLQILVPRWLPAWLGIHPDTGTASDRPRAMREDLARYVPGAVLDQMNGGANPECGEREVTVMFIDLRDFTAFADVRSARETFCFVSRYTELISGIVDDHGGSVVEFNGDGMMAVFGAPGSLPRKERRAVQAARRMLREICTLEAEAQAAGLSLGIGIATGPVFVGNIRAVDRWIWSAIGNTTNLASRFQFLSRELDASIVIDEETRRRASIHVHDFCRLESVAIRGRREPVDVFALPATPALARDRSHLRGEATDPEAAPGVVLVPWPTGRGPSEAVT